MQLGTRLLPLPTSAVRVKTFETVLTLTVTSNKCFLHVVSVAVLNSCLFYFETLYTQ